MRANVLKGKIVENGMTIGEFYVSTKGNDANPGAKESNWAP